MKIDVAQWVSLLPLAEERTGHGIVLNGRLARGEDGRAELFVGELRLSFRSEDILEIEVVEAKDISPLSSTTVNFLLRRGAPILDIHPAGFCEGQPPQLKPFALAVRPSHLILGAANRFRELEREFLLKHGLIEA